MSEAPYFASEDEPMSRRRCLQAGVFALVLPPYRGQLFAQTRTESLTLLTAPIEMIGDWGHMIPGAAAKIVERMRRACLDGVRLVSDRQPTALRVDEHTSGTPAIWLHPDRIGTAWIIVDIGERDWSKLAYQFGHELGHVLANSWRSDAKPAPPCQWLEEAMVEAFSLRGLARLSQSWRRDPPFPQDGGFADAIADYRQQIIDRYSAFGQAQGGLADFAAWFRSHQADVEAGALSPFAKAASLIVLEEYERAPEGVEALGALNRWPGRTGVPIEDYFRLWETSCSELSASSELPDRLRDRLGFDTPPG